MERKKKKLNEKRERGKGLKIIMWFLIILVCIHIGNNKTIPDPFSLKHL